LNKSGQTKREKFDDKIKPENPELLFDVFEILNTKMGMNFSYISDFLSIDEKMLSVITGISPDSLTHRNNVVPIGSKTS